ncbi:hypothetical protein F3Y22_tig00116971pilonHSYRG00959 [Hibiscus syriacus]|uniref:C2 domain-containing protein n=1 Tax=Hibiscus syriacus TaxID=106335 RepID=A0A6A2XQG2_HIBSY|nr:hypothetical protein F3Y22_tig00116971pilonHSYRG00959 [Hibiscus syriacus]
MEELLGLLRIHVNRGVNLAVRNVRTSDPYIIFGMGNQSLKTEVIDRDVNPVWDEDLTLSIRDLEMPIQLTVYDCDRFSRSPCTPSAPRVIPLAFGCPRIARSNGLGRMASDAQRVGTCMTHAISLIARREDMATYRFNMDDEMGDAEFDINTFIEDLRMDYTDFPDGTILAKQQPSRQNCLAEASTVILREGKDLQTFASD